MKVIPFLLSTLVLCGAFLSPRNSYCQTQMAPVSKKAIGNDFDPTRDAAADMTNALAIAGKEHKHVLIYVGGTWCSWCKKLDRVLNEKELQDILSSKYVVLRINYSSENRNKLILAKLPSVVGYPHLFVSDKDGKILHSEASSELEGLDQYDRHQVLSFLRKWAP